jgi:Ca2+-binding RTX toxin-like protein
MATIIGTNGNDTLAGDPPSVSQANDIIYGLDGADLMVGWLGSDTLDGGAGNDTLVAGAVPGDSSFYNIIPGGDGATDYLYGGAGDDFYYVDTSTDVIIETTGNGFDVAFTSANFFLASGVELEVLAVGGNTSVASGGATLVGNELNNQLIGGNGNDTLNGGAGNDSLYGGTGNDWFSPNGGDFVDGGLGTDVLEISLTSETTARLLNFTGDFTSSVYATFSNYVINIETLALGLGSGNDTIWGGSVSSSMSGNGGNDFLVGGTANDALFGGAGNDYLVGGGSNDDLRGGDGDDTLNGESDPDLLTGGLGADIIYGGDGNDYIYGEGGNDLLIAGGGNDHLYGGDGADSLYGGDGDDRFYQISSDYVDGGAGFDTIDLDLSTETVGRSIDFTNGLTSWLFAITGSYVVNTEAVYLLLGSGSDTVWGGAGNDTIVARDGNNFIVGGDGDDAVYGGSGNDTLIGGAGADTIGGASGNDILVGGAGNDVFAFSAPMGSGIGAVNDYSIADDVIHLRQSVFSWLPSGALSASAFTIGASATTADHRILYDATTGNLAYDIDGTGAAAATVFANIGTGLAMTAGEFLVV